MKARWWERRNAALAAMLLSMVPLLWPALPPLADLPGHVGRYHIAAAIGHAPMLAQHWTFEWRLIGNLGVDLVVQALTPILSVEHAAKLVVLLIPPLWVGGLIRVSRASGGRVSAAAAFAFPLAYGFPFQFGFVNFMLAAGLALHAWVLWIELGRGGRLGLRTMLFVPIACALWVAHSFGWGLFGLLAFAAELQRQRGLRQPWTKAAALAAVQCLPLAVPLVFMLGGGASAGPVQWDWKAKASWFPALLRERWKWYDVACAFVPLALLWMGLRDRRLRFDSVAGTGALLCFAAFVGLPRLMLGGAYVDMRMLAPALAIALVGLRFEQGHARLERWIALAGAGFFVLRMATSTAAMLLFANTQQAALAVIPHLPRGAAVLVLVDEPCASDWRSDRLGHIAGIAVARRDIFENGQWALPGQQLVRPRHPRAAPYFADPSQLVYPASCEYRPTDFATAIRDFDRGTFTHVWTLGFAPRAALATDVTLIWGNRVSALYAVHPQPLASRGQARVKPADGQGRRAAMVADTVVRRSGDADGRHSAALAGHPATR